MKLFRSAPTLNEQLSRPGHDHGADRPVVSHLHPGLGQIRVVLSVECVQPLGAVQRDHRDVPVSGQVNAHGSPVADIASRNLTRLCRFLKHPFRIVERFDYAVPVSATKSDPGFSQSIERGLAILSSFGPDRPLMGVSELAREVGLRRCGRRHDPSLRVATLAALGYLEQDAPSRKYRLGTRVIDLGFSAINSMELGRSPRALPAAPE